MIVQLLSNGGKRRTNFGNDAHWLRRNKNNIYEAGGINSFSKLVEEEAH